MICEKVAGLRLNCDGLNYFHPIWVVILFVIILFLIYFLKFPQQKPTQKVR